MSGLEGIQPGLSLKKRYRVEKASTARHLGSGGVDVLATPEMVRMMEETAMAVVADLLPPGSTTVGISVDVQHLAPTPVGFEVEITATLTEVDGRRLRFEVVARDDVEEVGQADHWRAVIDIGRFMERIHAKVESR